MAVSTISSALGATGGINPESNKVIHFLNGGRSAEQMIQEYFGLRKEVIYSNDGSEVVDMINEFKDPVMLKKKKVCYKEYFRTKGLTEEMFYKIVSRELIEEKVIEDVPPLIIHQNGNTDTTSTGEPKKKPVVQRRRGRTKKNTK